MKKVKFILLLVLLFPLLLNAQKTNCDNTKELKKINSTDYQKLAGKLTNQIKAKGYKVENSLPSGYVKDGSVDYTPEILKFSLGSSKIKLYF